MRNLDIRKKKIKYSRSTQGFTPEVNSDFFVPAQSSKIESASEAQSITYKFSEQKSFQKDTNKRNSGTHRNFIWFKLSLVAITAIVIISGLFVGSKIITFANSVSLSKQNFTQNIVNTIGSSIPGLQILDQSSIAADIREKKSVNILLLGYGGDGHDGAYLTDSMLLMSINFATNKVSLISIPRDLWVKIPTDGYDGSYAKINAAYAYGLDQSHFPNKLPQFNGVAGAGELSKYEVSNVLGLHVDCYVSMDFSGFKQIVDTLGGVNINVDNSFSDYSYPNGDENDSGPYCIAPDPNNSPCRYKQIHFDSGEQFMDGARALEYVRSRHASGSEGSDFARSRRQQKLISAIQQKALSLGMLPRIFDLMSAIQGHFQTDLSFAEIKDLFGYIGKINFDVANKGQLSDDNLLVSSYSDDGQWILTPTTGLDQWDQIHTYVYDILNGIPYQSK